MNAVAVPRFEMQVEHYSEELCAELLPMLKANWQESSSYTEQIVFSPDLKRYKELDDRGMVLCVTGRDQGVLVGYAIWYIVSSLNYQGKSAHGVALYVKEGYRGRGLELFRRSESVLRAQGIRRFYWFAKPGSLLYKLALHTGYIPDEMIMEKTWPALPPT